MSGNHSAPQRRRDGRKKNAAPRGGSAAHRPLLIGGWVFLGLMIALAVAVLIPLVKDPPAEPSVSVPTVAPGPAGSAFTAQGTQELTTQEGQGGRTVDIRGVDCDYTPPAEITFGRLETVDLSGVGERACANAANSGWGEVKWSVTDNGSLLLRSAEMRTLTGAEFESQKAFLASGRPEALSRTFLENIGLIGMLRDYGLTLSTQVENNDGEIVFRGVGTAPGTECTARFTFLYSGAFDQAVIRAVTLADAVTTDRVTPLARAIRSAVTWTAGSGGEIRLTAVELRHVRGIPFYVFTCSDGTAAYALAVDEEALAAVPGAAEIYARLLSDGIENNVTPSGGE